MVAFTSPRIAIVGSGPSGFFAADALLRAVPEARVDMFERFPVPFGLVRHGVAPDQAKIKSVVRAFARIAAEARFGFYGNVQVGRDLTIEDLRGHYDAIILAVGALRPRRLGVPGEELPGCHTSTEVVGWYNGHPDFSEAEFDFSCERAVVIGNGNVALDVARFLAKGREGLGDADIPSYALAALGRSCIREVVVVGRRGPVQCRFTVNELKELLKIPHAQPVFPADERGLDAASEAELAADGLLQRTHGVMSGYAEAPDPGFARHIVFRFLRSPVRFLGSERLEGVEVERNCLIGRAGEQRLESTGEREVIPAGLAVVCVGYLGDPLEGVPFDESAGVVPNREGRVMDGDTPVPGLYVVGWIKHTNRGVIGDTKADSAGTVQSLIADLPRLSGCRDRDPDGIERLLASRGIDEVQFSAWEKLDAEELERGRQAGKAREKFTRIPDMLAFLRSLDA